ncbi:uncharacterized protein LOC117300307 [Asterias rubens]|uniref:uncharacterized protein LOC117300307 n=1 Tax=Asterias rubens TaxID=7604 RepID=UPI00145579FA|nr:uncharacterized protein LOC117300307 [Asterias rubens]
MDYVWVLFWSLAVPVIAYITVNLATRDPAPMYGIYAVPGRWFSLKYYTMKVMLALVRRKRMQESEGMDGDSNPALRRVRELEVYCGIGDDPNGHNSFYVNGSDLTGATRLIARVAIRPDARRDVWFILRLPGRGDLVLPRHPHCTVSGVTGQGFNGAGLECSVIEPLSKWKIDFNGYCRGGIRKDWSEVDNRPLVHVKCSFTWTASTTFYDFATDVHPSLAAENIAKEKWSKQLFQNLKSMEQGHFEQFGTIEGVVQVDDGEEQGVVLTGVKDRSSGPRRWTDLHSYILNFIVLENGTCIQIGAFCFPGRVSNLTTGFIIHPSGEVIPAIHVDLPLADLMEQTEDPPMKFAFSMQPLVGDRLSVEVTIDDVMFFNMDRDWSVQIREGLSEFNVNGVRGLGVCEILKRYQGSCPVPENYDTPT